MKILPSEGPFTGKNHTPEELPHRVGKLSSRSAQRVRSMGRVVSVVLREDLWSTCHISHDTAMERQCQVARALRRAQSVKLLTQPGAPSTRKRAPLRTARELCGAIEHCVDRAARSAFCTKSQPFCGAHPSRKDILRRKALPPVAPRSGRNFSTVGQEANSKQDEAVAKGSRKCASGPREHDCSALDR